MTTYSLLPLRLLPPAELRGAPTPFLLDYVAAALRAIEAEEGLIADARSLIIGLELHCRSLSEPLPDADVADLLSRMVKSRDTIRTFVAPVDPSGPAEDDRSRLLCALDGLAELAGRSVLGSLDTAHTSAQ